MKGWSNNVSELILSKILFLKVSFVMRFLKCRGWHTGFLINVCPVKIMTFFKVIGIAF